LSENLKKESYQRANRNLEKVFKDWYKNYNKPQNLMPKYCQLLSLPTPLAEKAQKIVDNI
jgi:transcription initiation factor TFIIIB Brf1 subunit/transcription initiation factor TFIIB